MQNIFIYPGATIELFLILKQFPNKKIFLVTGKDSFYNSGAKSAIEKHFHGYDFFHYYDFNINPDFEDVKKGVSHFIQEKADIIIAVGGGSVIDMAKLINYYSNVNFNCINNTSISNTNFIPLPFICIPTTAGSGSEATHFAVMYIDNAKFSISHPKLLPEYVIIDTKLHYSQTPYQKAVSGIDALAQSIESFWSVQSTVESRLYSELALQCIWENLLKAVHEGEELAHLKLAIGSFLAGKAICIAKTTAPHAIAYGFTKKIGLPHGHAVALTLSQFFEFNFKNVKVKTDLYETKMKIFHILKCRNIPDGKRKIDNFIAEAGLQTKLSKLGSYDKNEIRGLLDTVNIQRLSNNPKSISNIQMIQIFENIF